MKKVILVTGASSGIGKATALHLIKEGHIVYGAARRLEKMKELEETGGHALRMDVMEEDQVQAVVQQIMDDQGRLDVLVNNAGYATYGSVEETPIEDARRQFEVNIFGLARLTQLVLPQMREQKAGTIINMSSVGGKIYTPMGSWYHATKHALEGWSDCLRLEAEQFGIDVVIIEPGLIATEFGDVMRAPMLERSGSGPYADMAKSLAKATRDNYGEDDSTTSPYIIANLVSKAIEATKPKTRYSGGKMSGMVLFMRRWLPDRWFDRAIMSQIK